MSYRRFGYLAFSFFSVVVTPAMGDFWKCHVRTYQKDSFLSHVWGFLRVTAEAPSASLDFSLGERNMKVNCLWADGQGTLHCGFFDRERDEAIARGEGSAGRPSLALIFNDLASQTTVYNYCARTTEAAESCNAAARKPVLARATLGRYADNVRSAFELRVNEDGEITYQPYSAHPWEYENANCRVIKTLTPAELGDFRRRLETIAVDSPRKTAVLRGGPCMRSSPMTEFWTRRNGIVFFRPENLCSPPTWLDDPQVPKIVDNLETWERLARVADGAAELP